VHDGPVADQYDPAPNLAVFCDYENVALGVQHARYDTFDIELVLEHLLNKGKIIVKKAYADWERFKALKRPMHEAAFELIEIPHVSYSGKNSADIRMVVDALDLCYTKEHVDVFVIVSGDSDFSPLVSKLRENNKTVIGLGVKNSSSDLLVDNCDEFVYYDDLVRSAGKRGPKASGGRAQGQAAGKKEARGEGGSERRGAQGQAASAPAPAATATEAASTELVDRGAEPRRDPKREGKPPEASGDRQEALDLVLDTVEALFRERNDSVWGSQIKQTLKRKRPHFSETYYGYRTFNQLLEDASSRGLLELKADPKSGGYVVVGFGDKA
jgi:uncharacterized protein (TIGR00288 family)